MIARPLQLPNSVIRPILLQNFIVEQEIQPPKVVFPNILGININPFKSFPQVNPQHIMSDQERFEQICNIVRKQVKSSKNLSLEYQLDQIIYDENLSLD